MLYIVHERHVDRETVKDVQMKFAYSPETSLQMVFAGILPNQGVVMNKQSSDILLALAKNKFNNQRELAAFTGHALGVINKELRNLEEEGFVKELALTRKAKNLMAKTKPQNAIILAAGFGMRMVPINTETPKALLTVDGEVLIERQIRQLQEVGITKIDVVVGFMKERFEYLMDDFGVNLIVNPLYASHNNISSLAAAAKKLANTYIVPCDVWCENNPFAQDELYSWYMVSDEVDEESDVRINRKNELVRAKNAVGNKMIGISYLCGEEAEQVKERILKMNQDAAFDDKFWEEALYTDDRMIVTARAVTADSVMEINTYEQLREIDENSGHLKSDALEIIAEVFQCKPEDIVNIQVLKKGMTNRSFLFECKGRKYIMRIPGEGTDQMINRRQEAAVYAAIRGKGLCDDPVYINPDNGYKITAFLEGVRNCDPEIEEDVARAVIKMREFHQMGLQVKHTFDIKGQTEFYESLWNGKPSMYRDYKETKANVMSLWDFINSQKHDWCLTHIDAVCDNFLFFKDENGEEQVQLTDWEYSGMQDPHVDIAMFCIYAIYDKDGVDAFIDRYFEGKCDKATRCKIYCYVAASGLLWSNWCEYKAQLGIEFGEYSLRQYRYGKDFYRYAKELMEEIE